MNYIKQQMVQCQNYLNENIKCETAPHISTRLMIAATCQCERYSTALLL